MRPGNRAPDVREAGFSYIALLFVVAIVGFWLARVGPTLADKSQREREQALKEIGDDVVRSIGSYYMSGVVPEFPRTWADLLEDRRAPVARRHLRRIPVDPLTNTTDWDLVRDPTGALIGIRSKSEKRPYAVTSESGGRIGRYRDWSFVYAPTPSQ